MRKIIIIALFLGLFFMLSGSELYINKDGVFYKVQIDDETGDTLSMEKIEVKGIEPEKENIIVAPGETAVFDDDPQFLRKYIPYKWQIGIFGLTQGSRYGVAIAQGLYMPGTVIAGSGFIMPVIMFLAPPMFMPDTIVPIAIPIVDWGYRLGFADYFAARAMISKNNFLTVQAEWLAPVTLGLLESWGGYFLVKDKGFRRAAGHFYAAGAVLGYAWGGLLGIYTGVKLDNTVDQESAVRIGLGTALFSSIALRAAGFMIGNNKDLSYRSYDSWIIAVNTIPGILIGLEYYVWTENMPEEVTLTTALCGIATSVGTGYLLRNTHFDDGNAVMLMIGGALGASFGAGVNIAMMNVINKFSPTIVAAGMIAGEFAVYALRRSTIGFDIEIPENVGMSIMPDFEKNGINVGLNIGF